MAQRLAGFVTQWNRLVENPDNAAVPGDEPELAPRRNAELACFAGERAHPVPVVGMDAGSREVRLCRPFLRRVAEQ